VHACKLTSSEDIHLVAKHVSERPDRMHEKRMGQYLRNLRVSFRVLWQTIYASTMTYCNKAMVKVFKLPNKCTSYSRFTIVPYGSQRGEMGYGTDYNHYTVVLVLPFLFPFLVGSYIVYVKSPTQPASQLEETNASIILALSKMCLYMEHNQKALDKLSTEYQNSHL
jgi:hypothetical protein